MKSRAATRRARNPGSPAAGRRPRHEIPPANELVGILQPADGRIPAATLRLVSEVLNAFEVCNLDANILVDALNLPVGDYEDAAQMASASAYRLDAIVTRDLSDFKNSAIPAFAPAEFLARLGKPLP